MHYTKSIIYYNTKGSWPHKLQEAKYKTMCNQEAVSKTTNRKVKMTTCVECLKAVLIKENDKLAKIAGRIVELESVVVPKLPEMPSFLKKCICGISSGVNIECPIHNRIA